MDLYLRASSCGSVIEGKAQVTYTRCQLLESFAGLPLYVTFETVSHNETFRIKLFFHEVDDFLHHQLVNILGVFC